VKRLLVLVAALPVAAVFFIPASASSQGTLVSIQRAAPLQVTARTTPRRDRFKPYTFTTTGRVVPPTRLCDPNAAPGSGSPNCIPLLCPPGVTDVSYCLQPGRPLICSGVVTVRYQKRTTTVSARNVVLRPDCTYRSRVTFTTNLPTRRGVLNVRARFQGNVVLLPRNSRTHQVRAG